MVSIYGENFFIDEDREWKMYDHVNAASANDNRRTWSFSTSDGNLIIKNTDGTISIIIPADCGLTVEQIAQKDVPTGLKYKIVNEVQFKMISSIISTELIC